MEFEVVIKYWDAEYNFIENMVEANDLGSMACELIKY